MKSATCHRLTFSPDRHRKWHQPLVTHSPFPPTDIESDISHQSHLPFSPTDIENEPLVTDLPIPQYRKWYQPPVTFTFFANRHRKWATCHTHLFPDRHRKWATMHIYLFLPTDIEREPPVTLTFSPDRETMSREPYMKRATSVWALSSRTITSFARWFCWRFCKRFTPGTWSDHFRQSCHLLGGSAGGTAKGLRGTMIRSFQTIMSFARWFRWRFCKRFTPGPDD